MELKTEDRRTGKTTRQVDGLVQQLFKAGKIELTENSAERAHIYNKLSSRFKNEHEIELKIFNYNEKTIITL